MGDLFDFGFETEEVNENTQNLSDESLRDSESTHSENSTNETDIEKSKEQNSKSTQPWRLKNIISRNLIIGASAVIVAILLRVGILIKERLQGSLQQSTLTALHMQSFARLSSMILLILDISITTVSLINVILSLTSIAIPSLREPIEKITKKKTEENISIKSTIVPVIIMLLISGVMLSGGLYNMILFIADSIETLIVNPE